MATSEQPDRWIPSLLTFGSRLAAVRHEKGWNIKQAADICGVPPATWRGWELDGRVPHDPVEVVAVIRVKTGVDEEWLLRGDTNADDPVPAGRLNGDAPTTELVAGASVAA